MRGADVGGVAKVSTGARRPVRAIALGARTRTGAIGIEAAIRAVIPRRGPTFCMDLFAAQDPFDATHHVAVRQLRPRLRQRPQPRAAGAEAAPGSADPLLALRPLERPLRDPGVARDRSGKRTCRR